MIRTTPQRRFRVSNRAALTAALVLAITSFSGIYNGKASNDEMNGQNVAASAQADNDVTTRSSSKSKLSISLLLFGRG